MQKKKKLLLVCSSGGHLMQLYTLSKELCDDYECVWVCFNKSDARSMLAGYKTHWGYFPTNRNIPNLIRNIFLARKILSEERPDCVISTGAGIAVPFLWLARFFKAKSVYIESFARKNNLSITGKLVYWFVDKFFVQSEKLENQYRKARYFGTIY